MKENKMRHSDYQKPELIELTSWKGMVFGDSVPCFGTNDPDQPGCITPDSLTCLPGTDF